MVERTLSHYRIGETLGEGGMGVVYKARDLRLDRFVALKLLRPGKIADTDWKRRLAQEARAASALNHPNIVTVYDIGEADDTPFIAMEYVAGRPLNQVIGRKGLPLQQALDLAIQIAGALAAAHRSGIMHLDLKPGNIMITRDGSIKVLDFGLAKLLDPAAVDCETAPLHTAERRIIGTAAYMSPEQAEGKPLDTRSDVFSFGAVVYEMITGRRAFRGDTQISTLSAILTRDPKPVREVLENTPGGLDRILALCLRKDPKRRFQHMDDVRIELQALRDECDEPAPAAPSRARDARLPAWTYWAMAVALLAMGTGIGRWLLVPKSPLPILQRLTSDSGFSTDPAVSPDGKLLAYASDQGGEGNLDIWVRQLAGGEPVRLTHGPADQHQPSFSPDGTTIVFRSERDGGGIYAMPALGGDARLLAREAFSPSFSPDGSLIAYSGGPGLFRGIFVVSTDGGPAREVSRILGSHRPFWSPDGRHVLVVGSDFKGSFPERSDWWVLTPDSAGGSPVKTGAVDELKRHGLNSPVPFSWTREGVLFSADFGSTRNIWQVPLSTGSFRVGGAPRRITAGTEIEEQPTPAGGGRLVFSTETAKVDLWMLPMNARTGKPGDDLRRLTQDGAAELPNLSADGKLMSFISTRLGNPDVWIKDLDSGQATSLVPTPWVENLPVISRDGSKVFYSAFQGGKSSIYSIGTKGGIPEIVCEGCDGPTDVSADGRKLLFQYGLNHPLAKLGVLDLLSGKRIETLKHPRYGLYRGHFSPDDRWVVFHADDPGRGTLILIAPFRAEPSSENDWIKVTDENVWTDAPRWSPDGNSIYYFSDRDGFRCIWAQRLDPATKRPVGAPIAVQHLHSRQRSVVGVNVNWLDLAVARDKLIFNLREVRGNLWMRSEQP